MTIGCFLMGKKARKLSQNVTFVVVITGDSTEAEIMETVTVKGFFLRFVVCTALCGLVKFFYPKVLVSSQTTFNLASQEFRI